MLTRSSHAWQSHRTPISLRTPTFPDKLGFHDLLLSRLCIVSSLVRIHKEKKILRNIYVCVYKRYRVTAVQHTDWHPLFRCIRIKYFGINVWRSCYNIRVNRSSFPQDARRTARRMHNWTKAHCSNIQASTTSKWIMKQKKKTPMSKLRKIFVCIYAVFEFIWLSLSKYIPRITLKWTTSTIFHFGVHKYQ
jgi:hypothetical protein